MNRRNLTAIKIFTRIVIGLGFLSAVMDRFGLWNGILDNDKLAWKNWSAFVGYTHSLLPWVSKDVAAVAAGVATGGEIIFAILLFLGWRTRLVANLSGILLLMFGIAMFLNFIKAPFDASVFSAAAACFLLAAVSKHGNY